MSQEDGVQSVAKAKVFFERAEKIAQSKNYDYAIDMYLEGLRCAPDSVVQGHASLHELALLRQQEGGKKPSMVERVKHLMGKTPLEQMLNAEYLFARDPDHIQYAEAILKAAAEGDYKKTTKWIGDIVFHANNNAPKPSFSAYMSLKEAYFKVGEFDRALAACQCASRLKPNDGDLAEELKNLSAELAVSKGRYDQGGDFRNSIQNRQEQEELQSQKGVVKTDDFVISAVEKARKEIARNPDIDSNIYNLAEALVGQQIEKSDAEAIKLLEDAYKSKGDFSFKKRADELNIQGIKRKMSKLKADLEANPDDSQIKAQLAEISIELSTIELTHYQLCVKNYPTDVAFKYEYAIRLMRDKKYDDAIPFFQEAQKDPRRKLRAMAKIGLCFLKKGWYSDAIDVFVQAIDSYDIKDDGIAKELRYNLACAYEENGESEKALDVFRKIAQLDFGYRDVRQHIDKLRTA